MSDELGEYKRNAYKVVGKLQNELTSIRNQLAEAQRENALKHASIQLHQAIIERVQQERDQLKQLADEYKRALSQSSDREHELKQELLASEASRERMRQYFSNAEAPSVLHIEDKLQWICGRQQILNESLQTAPTEALKLVRELIKYGIEHQHEDEDLCNQDRCNVCLKLQQALSELDKLCPKGEA